MREPQVFNTLNGVTGGVWREDGVISKALRSSAPESSAHWRPSMNPRHWLYWRREALVYSTGLPARLGVAAPRLIDLTEDADGALLRMEALGGRTGSALEVGDLVNVAEQLGRAKADAGAADDGWLSRGFLRDYSTSRPADFALADDDERWAHPLVAPYADSAVRESLFRLHSNRDRLLSIAESLPRRVCHLDVFPGNIFAGDSGVALIDWAFAGDGAIGEDVGNLIPDSVFDGQFRADELEEIEASVTEGYLRGLRAGGWTGDDRLAVLGMRASAVKYDWLVPRSLEAAGTTSTYSSPNASARELASARWAGLALIGRWADEAVTLADKLRVS